MAVPVTTDGPFEAGNPSPLENPSLFLGGPMRTFDVSADGRRILVVRSVEAGDAQLNVVLNWTGRLRPAIE